MQQVPHLFSCYSCIEHFICLLLCLCMQLEGTCHTNISEAVWPLLKVAVWLFRSSCMSVLVVAMHPQCVFQEGFRSVSDFSTQHVIRFQIRSCMAHYFKDTMLVAVLLQVNNLWMLISNVHKSWLLDGSNCYLTLTWAEASVWGQSPHFYLNRW